MKERITVLTLEEDSRLLWRRLLTDCFRKTGVWDSYLLPPCIILPNLESIDGDIDIGDGCVYPESRAVHNGWAWVLPVFDERIRALSRRAGLFISKNAESISYEFPPECLKIKGIASVETDGMSSRIVRFRPLRRDR